MAIDAGVAEPRYADASDDALMLAYQQGEEAAFREIVRRHAGLVRGLARRQLSREADQKDIVQQTFLQLHRARFDYRGDDKLRPWLATIAINLVKMHFRRRGRRPEVSLEVEHVHERETVGFEGQLEVAEQRVRVRRALAKLPAAQREVIELHWFQQLSFREVSDAVGASLSAVKVRAHRGYQRLRTLLAKEVTP